MHESSQQAYPHNIARDQQRCPLATHKWTAVHCMKQYTNPHPIGQMSEAEKDELAVMLLELCMRIKKDLEEPQVFDRTISYCPPELTYKESA